MRRTLFKLTLLLCVLASMSFIHAVVTDYSFTSTMGTYVEVSGGTVHGDNTNDTAVFNAVPIGFSFNYNGTVYDQISIATKGFIAMGPTVATSTLAISGGTTNNVIVALNRDIKSRTDGQLMSLLSGTAPNRKFTIQWKNYRRSPTSTPNDTLNFQIVLNETTNNIQFCYGYSFTQNYAVAATVQVGLRGAANTEYSNRSTTTDWTATTAGTTNTASCRLNDTIRPPMGLVYTWSPPQTGTPPLPAQVVSPANAATNVSLNATLNWLSGGGAPTGYRIYFGTNNPPTNIVNGTTTTALTYDPNPDLAYNTVYYWQIVPYNDYGNAAGCPVWSFTTMPDPTVVIPPTYTQNWDSVTAPNIPNTWTVINANNDANTWVLVSTADVAYSAPNVARCNFNANMAMDDWLVSPPLVLSADTFYRVQFYYKAQNATYPEKLEVKMGNAPTAAAMTTTLYNNNNMTNTTYQMAEITYGPIAAGTYYIGFHGYSDANMYQVYVDNVVFSAVVPVFNPPQNLTATSAVNSVVLNWQVPLESVPVGYKVFKNGTLITPTPITGLTYTDTDVVIGTNYSYYVTAVYTNPAGESVPSNTVTGTPQEALDPPSSLAVAVNGYTANLTWTAPGIIPVDTWIHWDSGQNDDSIGTGAAANFDVAARFPQADLVNYVGCNLTQVKFWPAEGACTYTVKVWTGGSANPYNAGTLVAQQLVTNPTMDAWNTITLTTPVPIPATGEVWFGVNVNTTTGYPAGCDAGPAHNGLGNMMYWQNAWTTLIALAPTLNYDWNLAAHVTNSRGETVALTPISQPEPLPIVNSGTLMSTGIHNTSSAAFASYETYPEQPLNRSHTGYKVYRGATLISTITNTATMTYADANLLPGTYSYTVTATYTGNLESVPVGPAVANIVAIFNPPTNLVGTATATNVGLTWSAPSPIVGNLAGYKVYRNGTLITPTPIVGTTYTDAAVTVGNTYLYAVTAVYTNPNGESVQSNTVSVPFGDNLDPVTDLAATVAQDDVSLTWVPPGGPIFLDWIHYDDGFNNDAIGTGAAANFDVAARFTQTELTGLHDRAMVRVRFFPNEAACTYAIKIYTGATGYTNPGTLIMTIPVTNPVIGEWNEVNLPTPVQIPTTNEMWIVMNCNTTTGYPAGCDDGPCNPYKSDLIFFNGAWDSLLHMTENNNPPIDINWNIQGLVTNHFGQLEPIPTIARDNFPPAVHNTGTPALSGLRKARNNETRDPDRSLIGYKVYRDGTLLTTINDVLVSNYTDSNLPNGTYNYTVTALYTGNLESPAAGPVQAVVDMVIVPTILEDGFETYDNFELAFAPWMVNDVDMSATYTITGTEFPNAGAAMAYIVFNPSATTPPMTTLTPHGGAKMVASFASTTPPNNDWMITPRIHLGTQSTISLWVKSYTAQYGLERFRVGVSTQANPLPATFAYLSGATYVEAPVEWTQFTYTVPAAYNNQNVYFGIRCVSNDAFIFFVDDVKIQGYNGYVGNDDTVVPVTATELVGNYPNPFNPETIISYNVKDDAEVKLEVYNLKGQKVKTLVSGNMKAGNHDVKWNGTDDKGAKVSSGVYFYRMSSGKYTSSRKMILMK